MSSQRIPDRLRAVRLHRAAERAMRPPPPHAWRHLGRDAVIVPPTRVELPQFIDIGDASIVHEHGWLCVKQLPGRGDPSLVIGARTSIGRFAKIVCAESVRIGDDALLAERVYISDVEHEPWITPSAEQTALGHPLSDGRPVVIGDRVFIGTGAVIKPGVTIGADAYVGAASVVREDVAPATVVVGNPARVIRRRDDDGRWVPV